VGWKTVLIRVSREVEHNDAIWGQTRYLAHRYGDRHDVRCTDRERSTSNVQLSTFNGVTERAHAGPNMGTDTMCIRRLHRVNRLRACQ